MPRYVIRIVTSCRRPRITGSAGCRHTNMAVHGSCRLRHGCRLHYGQFTSAAFVDAQQRRRRDGHMLSLLQYRRRCHYRDIGERDDVLKTFATVGID